MLENQLSLPLSSIDDKIIAIDTGHTQCHTFRTPYGAEVKIYQPNKDVAWTKADIYWLLEQTKQSLFNED